MKTNCKVLICLLLVCCMLLGACGGSGNNETQESTKETTNIMQKTNPADDDTLNVLMIGNSFCYYYPDELYGIAQEASVKMRICNVYYSGCKLEQHWNWWKNGEAHYEFFTYDENGRQKTSDCDLEYCLRQQNWDIISLQDASSTVRTTGVEAALEETATYRKDLITYLQEQFPYARLYWHQTWGYQVGYGRNGFKIENIEEQTAYYERVKAYSLAICKEFNIDRVNTGDAWQIVRAGGYDNMCARLSVNNGEGDYYHDGDIGGGQYLNACVWFEVLTDQSCVGNTFRPEYANRMDESLLATFQNAAHQAVENMKAEISSN